MKRIKVNLIKIAISVVLLIPENLLVLILSRLFELVYWFRPNYHVIIVKNLKLAFPELDDTTLLGLRKAHNRSLAYLIIDTFRLCAHSFDRILADLVINEPERVELIKQKYAGRGILFLSAHLGSFELLPGFLANVFGKLGIIVRQHSTEVVNTLLEDIRTVTNVESIPRSGALRKMVKYLRANQNFGLLFDQNVVRKDALFVPWFNKQAATTVAVGVAALKSRCPIVMCAVQRTIDRKFIFTVQELEYYDILDDAALNEDQKMEQITLRCVTVVEEYIRQDPAAWFWLHRRWKTRPEGEPELFYAK